MKNKMVKLLVVVLALAFSLCMLNGCSSKTADTSVNDSNKDDTSVDDSKKADANVNNSNKAENNKTENKIDDKVQVYNNSKYNLCAKYPQKWETKEDVMGSIVAFMSPLENESDKFLENFNICIEDLSGNNINVKQYNDFAIEQLKKGITNFEVISNTEYSGLKEQAYEIVFTGMQGELELKWKQIYTIKNNKAYVLTYTAQVDKFDEYLSYFEQFVLDLEY